MKAFQVIIRPVVLSLCALSLSACDLFLPSAEFNDYVSIDVALDTREIVLQAFISPEHGVMAEVMHTVSPNEKGDGAVLRDAEVVLWQDGAPLAQLHRKEMVADSSMLCYKFDYYLAPAEVALDRSHAYSIHVSAPGYPTAVSDDVRIPNPIRLDSVDFRRNSPVVAFFSAPEADVAYSVFLKGYTYGRLFADHILSPSMVFVTKAPGASMAYCDDYSPFFLTGDSVCVELLTLSPEASRYVESLRAYEASLEEPYVNYPEPVYSNVRGGTGVVAAFASSGSILAHENDRPWLSDYIERFYDLEDYYGHYWW